MTGEKIAHPERLAGMSALTRNNVMVKGSQGKPHMVFAHGYGCDQNMWRYVSPSFEEDYQVVLFDHVGAGKSDSSAYCPRRHESLQGYADDIVEICRELGIRDGVFVGHSVSAMMGIMAAAKATEIFSTLVLVGPSPCYINDGDYTGGFERHEIDELLESLDRNHLGWSTAMAPVIMGNPDRPELGAELAESFCRMDPEMARAFAKTTFLTDCRDILGSATARTLVLQCSQDAIAPLSVGEYVRDRIPGSSLVILNATGHCPNLSAPAETIAAIRSFL